MADPVSFGRWLSARRHLLDLTQEELARRVGCSVVTIRKLEADERRPSKQVAERLGASLGIPEADWAAFLTFARGEATPALAELPAAIPPRIGRPILPTPLTSLIGREQDLAAVHNQLLRDEVRLLTLAGPPGIGKTRLALAVAASLQDAFADGIVFIALAPISDPAFVVPAIAQTLGLKESGTRTLLELVQAHLRERQLLLVLDNCEQVLAAAPQVAELLSACPKLKVLATSRAALHIRGEQLSPVPPLLLPDPAHLPPAGQLAQIAAITLFVERAQAVQPTFQLTEANGAAVAAICARLDGLPLAIELVASRVRLLPPAALLGRLDNRLTLLTGGPRDLPERQRTLRGAIAWSYDLLGVSEQALFRRLGIFVGGWTLEAAEVISRSQEQLTSDVIDGLATLLDQSLVKQETGLDSTPRFSMLETIREYALELLANSSEMSVMQAHHTEYYVELAEIAASELLSEKQEIWLNRLDSEHDNLRMTLIRNLEPDGNRRIVQHLAGALGPYWNIRGRISEARRWLEAALETNTSALSPEHDLAVILARARALDQAGVMAWHQGDHAQSRRYATESLILFRELDDKPGIARALHTLGLLAMLQAEYVYAQTLMDESLIVSQEINDKVSICAALDILGHISRSEGVHAQAVSLHRQSLDLAHELNDQWTVCWRLNSLGESFYFQGEMQQAGDCFKQSLVLAHNHRDMAGLSWALYGLGLVAYAQQDYGTAQSRFRESVIVVQEATNNYFAIAQRLEGLASVAAVTGDPERVVCLSAAAASMRQIAGTPLAPVEQPLYARTLAAARTQLGETAFAAAWVAGQAMSLDQASIYALEGGV